MFPFIQLGPLALPAPEVILLISIWVGLSLAGKRAQLHGLESEKLDTLVLSGLGGFVIGGRFFYVAANFSAFAESPLDIISRNLTLFDPLGGFATGLIAGLIYGQRKGFSLWPTLDALTPFFATMMVGVGAAHLASGEAFGKETSLPWGMFMHGATRHPSQVYEIAVALFILNLVGLRPPFEVRGKQFLLFVAFTAGAALFLETFRGDSALMAGGIRQAQVVAWLILAGALVGFEQLQKGVVNENG